jgi:hypothetical protein
MAKKEIDGVIPYVRPPKTGTQAACNFFKTYYSLNRFSNWVGFMAARMDEGSKIAHKALLSTYDEETKRKKEKEFSERFTMIDELKVNRQIFIEIQLIRHIDNFLNYLSELLSEIFIQRPDTLRSSEQVEVSEVLKHDSIDDLVKALAERQVEKLSYNSFSDLSEFFLKRFKIELFQENLHPLIIEAIEIRNLATHNRCIINNRFCKRTGGNLSEIGKKKELFIDDLERILPEIAKAVIRVDKEAKIKLNLKGILFKNQSEVVAKKKNFKRS